MTKEQKELKRKLYNAVITHVSYVDKGANGKTFFLMKSEDQPDYEKQVKIITKKEDFTKVYGVVYAPDEVDAHGDSMTSDEIEKAQSVFMKNYQNIDTQHNFKKGAGDLIESAIALNDIEIGEHTITKGSWYIATEPTEEIKKEIISGNITSYSMAGTSEYEEIKKEEEESKIIKMLKKLLNMNKSEENKETEMNENDVKALIKSEFEGLTKDIAKSVIEAIKKEAESEEVKKAEFAKQAELESKEKEKDEKIEKLEKDLKELQKEVGVSKQGDEGTEIEKADEDDDWF